MANFFEWNGNNYGGWKGDSDKAADRDSKNISFKSCLPSRTV